MIQSDLFNYVNVLGKAADASWLRNEAIANNISNVDTPNYKRQDVDFEGVLQRAMGNSVFQTTAEKVNHVQTSSLTPRTYTDHGNYSYRIDGNNVDIDTENVALASNQLKYNALIESINSEFSGLKAVMK